MRQAATPSLVTFRDSEFVHSLQGRFITFSARETLPCKSNRIGEGISGYASRFIQSISRIIRALLGDTIALFISKEIQYCIPTKVVKRRVKMAVNELCWVVYLSQGNHRSFAYVFRLGF